MDDRARVLMSSLVGAAVGAAAGYLMFTERGRAWRTELEPRLDDLLGNVRSLQQSVERARTVAAEGWQSLQDIAHQELPRARPSWAGPERPQ